MSEIGHGHTSHGSDGDQAGASADGGHTRGDHGGHASGAGHGQDRDHVQHGAQVQLGGHRTHHFEPARVDRLVSAEREEMLRPLDVLAAAGVIAGQVMIDLGAGPGLFTLPAARLVGSHGQVYAVDVQPEMLEVCRRRAAEQGLSGMVTVLSRESHIPLPDATADRVLIAFVLHEADEPSALLGEARRLLKPGGEVAVVEWHKTEGTQGPPTAHRIGEAEVAEAAAAARLHATPAVHLGEHHYLMRLTL